MSTAQNQFDHHGAKKAGVIPPAAPTATTPAPALDAALPAPDAVALAASGTVNTPEVKAAGAVAVAATPAVSTTDAPAPAAVAAAESATVDNVTTADAVAVATTDATAPLPVAPVAASPVKELNDLAKTAGTPVPSDTLGVALADALNTPAPIVQANAPVPVTNMAPVGTKTNVAVAQAAGASVA